MRVVHVVHHPRFGSPDDSCVEFHLVLTARFEKSDGRVKNTRSADSCREWQVQGGCAHRVRGFFSEGSDYLKMMIWSECR